MIDLTKSISPFSAEIKFRRAVWSWLVWPMVKHLPRAGSRLRIIALRLFGARIGPACLIESGVSIWLPWNLDCSEGYVAIGRKVELYNYAMIKVGRMSVISQYSYVCTGTHDHSHPHMPLTWEPITIGSEVWVAAGVFIAPGVSIGQGCVVGARSVVTKSMPKWMVCAGNPCRALKKRIVGVEEQGLS